MVQPLSEQFLAVYIPSAAFISGIYPGGRDMGSDIYKYDMVDAR